MHLKRVVCRGEAVSGSGGAASGLANQAARYGQRLSGTADHRDGSEFLVA
jgi:hypothetical protein